MGVTITTETDKKGEITLILDSPRQQIKLRDDPDDGDDDVTDWIPPLEEIIEVRGSRRT